MFEAEWVDESDIKREKQKARELRRTSWWLNRVNEGRCYYCGLKVGAEGLTMDHVVPLIRGGKSNKGNIVPACKGCNNKKKYLLPIEWEEYLLTLKKDETVI
ncbi:MAG: HNH endonuclease [Deltaproteobacteria bacterium]|nr:HNH endonuclease [Deltaproteobacteria bacterium]